MATPLVFFGNECLATGVMTSAPILEQLLEAGYDITAIVIHNEGGNSRKAEQPEVARLAERHGIPVLAPRKLSDIRMTLESYGATVGVLAAYGRMVPQAIIDIFPAGIVNIHPSLLPLHRGPIPIESVILDGSAKTGVSLMRLVRAMDAGPVYAYSEYDLDGTESKQHLADELGSLGASMLVALLPRIIGGAVQGKPQDDTQATYDKLITKEAGILDWNKPARQLEREVRAYAEWPKSRTILGDHAVIVTQAHTIPSNSPGAKPGDLEIVKKPGVLMINTAGGTLCIDRLKAAGKGEMTADAFLNGYGRNLH